MYSAMFDQSVLSGLNNNEKFLKGIQAEVWSSVYSRLSYLKIIWFYQLGW